MILNVYEYGTKYRRSTVNYKSRALPQMEHREWGCTIPGDIALHLARDAYGQNFYDITVLYLLA